MKRRIKRILGVLALLVIIAIVAITMFASRIVKKAVETAGPRILGVPVTLGSAHVALLRGRIILKDLEIGNPEGFKTPYLFKMAKLDVDADMSTLTSDEIIVKKVHIMGPKIVYERGLKTSNIGALLDNLDSGEEEAKKEEKKEPEAEEDDADKKNVIIEDFLLDDGQISLSTTLALGQGLPIPLPAIHKTDIGRNEEKGGMSIREAVRMLFREIFSGVTGAVAGSVKLVGEGVKAVGETAVDAGGAVVDGAAAVGGTAIDGVENVGDAAVDGVKDVGGAVADGAGKIVDGVGGLLKHDKEE